MLLEVLVAASLVISLMSLYLSFRFWSRVRKVVAVVRGILATKRTKMVKPRKRYLIFEVIAVSGDLSRVEKPDVENALESSCRLLYGVLGYSTIKPSLIYYDESRGVGVISFRHSWRNNVLLMLSLIREISGVKVIVVPRATTGTRKKAMDYVKRV